MWSFFLFLNRSVKKSHFICQLPREADLFNFFNVRIDNQILERTGDYQALGCA